MKLISIDGTIVEPVQFWSLWLTSLAVAIGITIASPLAGGVWLGFLVALSFVGFNFLLVSLVAAFYVSATLAQETGEPASWALFPIALLAGFLLMSGLQTLKWSYKWRNKS